MTYEEKLLRSVEKEVEGLRPEAIVGHLFALGAIDRRSLEAYLIRKNVERRIRRGEGKCRAMDETAAEYCCSYEKVRSIVYRKP